MESHGKVMEFHFQGFVGTLMMEDDIGLGEYANSDGNPNKSR